ncbi:EexN family lipoprotein [Escherichia coli]|uniref:EexN family lipoprotein n=1 Tax=Escherichia coli TaxID=562 RepID=UPI00200D2432|nr:EexN family lipoprotein [Escherichia coli]MCL0914189.1 EexN family lipoprotein [Escherichia coli]
MKRNIIIVAFISLIGASGCDNKIYDVSYYKEQAMETIKQCKDGSIKDENCKNAKEAIRELNSEKLFRDTLK